MRFTFVDCVGSAAISDIPTRHPHLPIHQFNNRAWGVENPTLTITTGVGFAQDRLRSHDDLRFIAQRHTQRLGCTLFDGDQN